MDNAIQRRGGVGVGVWGGYGRGQASTYRAKKNKCRSFPPVRKHAPGWLLVMFTTRRMQNKTSCIRFHAATLHCAHDKDMFIAFLSYEIEQLSFLGRLYRVSAFGTLHHLQASNKHSAVCHLWHPNLLGHAFWKIVSHIT